MASLEASNMLIGQAQTGLATQIGEVKGIVQSLDSKLDGLVDRIYNDHSEPRATPAGRAITERLTAIESPISTMALRVDSLESFRDELRGAMKLLQIVVSVSTILSTVAFIVSILHGFRVI